MMIRGDLARGDWLRHCFDSDKSNKADPSFSIQSLYIFEKKKSPTGNITDVSVIEESHIIGPCDLLLQRIFFFCFVFPPSLDPSGSDEQMEIKTP